MAEVSYGTDLDWLDDMNPTGQLVEGFTLLGQAVYRRLITPRGSVLDSPDDGLALEEFLHAPLTEAALAAIPGQVRQEILKDERIVGAEIDITADLFSVPRGFSLAIRCTPSEGPDFELVISVSEAATKLVSLQGAA